MLPRDLEAHINRIVQEPLNDIGLDHPLVDRSKCTLHNWVSDAAARTADETGDDDYRRVSTQDLQRDWATRLRVEEGVSPRIVMAFGGWSSYDDIESYLAALTEENIHRAKTAVAL